MTAPIVAADVVTMRGDSAIVLCFPDAFAFRIVFPISTVPPQTPPQIAAELPLTVLFTTVTELPIFHHRSHSRDRL